MLILKERRWGEDKHKHVQIKMAMVIWVNPKTYRSLFDTANGERKGQKPKALNGNDCIRRNYP